MAAEKQCIPLIAGAGEQGHKELPPITDGFRESTQRWRGLLPDLKRRGLKQDPQPAFGDGALGFWTALRGVFAATREQRCRAHTAMNALNVLPNPVQTKPKGDLHHIGLPHRI